VRGKRPAATSFSPWPKGDVLALDPGAAQPAMRSTTANQDVFSFTAGIIYPNVF
jgi:hypothetical protein